MPVEVFAGHPWPLLQGSGAFLIGVGAFVLLAALAPRLLVPLVFAGFGAGYGLMRWLGVAVPLSRVPVAHLWWFGAAVAFEVIAIVAAVFTVADERRLLALVLLIVAVHFAIMGGSHGPLMLGFAAAGILNAVAALALRAAPIRIFILVDGLLKLAFGAYVLGSAPALTYADLLSSSSDALGYACSDIGRISAF